MTIENYSRGSSDPVALTRCETGTGRSAWRAIDADAPGLFAFISSEHGTTVPLAPETDRMCFAIYEEGAQKPTWSIDIVGRVGLNSWYLTNIGHAPDAEPDGLRPILELIYNIAGHLLLQYFEHGRIDV